MEAYGNIYRFAFDSINGSEIEIIISKAGYTGEATTRPLGMAPVLRRENSDNIYGTSLEIYAECVEAGEYAQLYTTSAFEYKVTLYRDGRNIWAGYISPELYAEPDLPTPYDVQIIATDGLGELKFFTFESNGYKTIEEHIKGMLNQAQVTDEIQLISQMTYGLNEDTFSAPNELLRVKVDLSHENGENCYDVLQRILSSLHAGMTLHDGKWVIWRETDLAYIVSRKGVSGYDNSGADIHFPISNVGSATAYKWWPIGNMTVNVIPAKKGIELTSPFHYKEDILGDVEWSLGEGVQYDEVEEAYILPDQGSYITKHLDFDAEVGYRLLLKILARNVGSTEEQNIGVRVLIDGRTYSGRGQYWLLRSATTNEGIRSHVWSNIEGTFEEELPVPSEADTASDAVEIEVFLPLYRSGARSYAYASSIDVMIFNPAGIHDIYVYDVTVAKYEQPEGYILDVNIDNGAREAAADVDLSMSDGALTPDAGIVAMTGIPLKPSEVSDVITVWGLMSGDTGEYLDIMGQDYAMSVKRPLLRYSGRLNVPRGVLPLMFKRDKTFYWVKTYDYDLREDEMGVELISIPSDILAGYEPFFVQEGQFYAADGEFYVLK